MRSVSLYARPGVGWGGHVVWGDIVLLSPGWLLLLPVIVFMAIRRGARAQTVFTPIPSIQVRHPLVDRLHSVSARRTESRLHARIIVAFGLSLMVLAMTQPVRLGAPLDDETVPVDLVILVDTSVTMTLKDYVVEGLAVDRLSIAKVILDRFLSEFEGRRVAVVVVGQPSAIWLPLTSDYDLARHMVGRLKLSLAGRHAGLGDALVEVANQFADKPGRMALLVSDGVMPAGSVSPVEGGKQFAQSGIKLMALGIGAKAKQAADSQYAGLIYEPLDLDLLQEIVQPSGGVVHHAVTVEQAVASLREQIRNLHMETGGAASDNRRQIPLYPLLLTPGVLLLLWLSLFAIRSRSAGES